MNLPCTINNGTPSLYHSTHASFYYNYVPCSKLQGIRKLSICLIQRFPQEKWIRLSRDLLTTGLFWAFLPSIKSCSQTNELTIVMWMVVNEAYFTCINGIVPPVTLGSFPSHFSTAFRWFSISLSFRSDSVISCL